MNNRCFVKHLSHVSGNGWSEPLKQNRTNAFRNTVGNIINQMFYQRAEKDREEEGGERVGQVP